MKISGSLANEHEDVPWEKRDKFRLIVVNARELHQNSIRFVIEKKNRAEETLGVR